MVSQWLIYTTTVTQFLQIIANRLMMFKASRGASGIYAEALVYGD